MKMNYDEVPLYFKVTLRVFAVLDQVRERLHVVVKESCEPDFERFTRAKAIARTQRRKLPKHCLN